MMPFAFDLISTFVIGSTLPVATTERRIVPRSTTAILAGSIVVEAPVRAVKPQMPATTIRTKMETMQGLAGFLHNHVEVLRTSRPKGFQPAYVDSADRQRR